MNLIQQIFSTTDRPVIDNIPIVDYKDDCFALRDGRVMDIVQLRTRDFDTASEDDVEYDSLALLKFFRLYADDIKIVALSFPTDTKSQQQYLAHILSRTKNSVFRYFLQYKLEELIYIEKNRTDREFYLFLWAKSPAEMQDNLITARRCLGSVGLLIELDEIKKEQILFKLANKNTSVSSD